MSPASTSDFAAGAIGVPPRQGVKHDPYRLGRGTDGGAGAKGHGDGGPAPKPIVVGFGFWLFILSDIIMFAAFFAAYAVLKDSTDGGPSGLQLFEKSNAAIETALLLISSFTCGLASLAMKDRNPRWFQAAMSATALLGAAFLTPEAREFAGLVLRGDGPHRSAFLSAFFTLVGCHGLHVTIGMLWLLTMMAQVLAKGFRDDIRRRTACFILFWHALDIIWVGVLTVVYILGTLA